MPKYNEKTLKLVESFLANLFGKTVKRATDQEMKKLSKADPDLGKILKRAAQVQKDADKWYNSLSQKEKDDEYAAFMKKYGSK